MQATCEERIGAQLTNRLEMLVTDCEACQYGDYCDEHINSNDVLSVDRNITYDVHLSTGGPADYFKVFLDSDGIYRIEYHFQDWYDGAVRRLTGSEFDQVEEWILANLYIEEIM